jgi:hypothetical protein
MRIMGTRVVRQKADTPELWRESRHSQTASCYYRPTTGSSDPLCANQRLRRWVEKTSELTKPAAIHWVDGSQEEYDLLCAQMVDSGALIKLNQGLWPGCF